MPSRATTRVPLRFRLIRHERPERLQIVLDRRQPKRQDRLAAGFRFVIDRVYLRIEGAQVLAICLHALERVVQLPDGDRDRDGFADIQSMEIRVRKGNAPPRAQAVVDRIENGRCLKEFTWAPSPGLN
jgi:hypothetical protein